MTASAAPPEVPMVYPVDWSLLTTAVGDFDAGWKAIGLTSAVDGIDYQRGRLAAIRVPGDLLPCVIKTVSKDEDLVVFCGTVPIIDGQFRPGSQFDCRLSVPGSDPIDLSYATHTTAASAPVAD